ncbi:MAG: UspA domain protein [Solirubrobacterales bacterium]|jgi:nucleotide-binding universal stress UspA family protein|nr:UspA domain protein [Solirubrobacterales bacterium]
MNPKVIVSYDDTAADRDALALGRALGVAGADIALAYVRHDARSQRHREELHQHEAEDLLARGAIQYGDPAPACHVVTDASTADGLRALVEQELADVIVFGSDYRTALGHIGFGTSARRLLDGGPAAVALAPAGLRERGVVSFGTIRVLGGEGDEATRETARSLAAAFGAELSTGPGTADLLVVASRPEAPAGRVMVSAATEYAIETATSPVLVVARGTRVDFGVRVTV